MTYEQQLKSLVWVAWYEMNAIRARSGVPLDFDGDKQSISEDYWLGIVDLMSEVLGEDATPWPPEYAGCIFDQIIDRKEH